MKIFLSFCLLIIVVKAIGKHHFDPPILVLSDSKALNPFYRYAGEILKAEGFNLLIEKDIAFLSKDSIDKYDIIILTETSLSPQRITILEGYVKAGGNLIAFKPESKQLTRLFGISKITGTINEGYIKIDTSTIIGSGLESRTMKFHGSANKYVTDKKSNTSIVASLFKSTEDLRLPAVISNAYGSGYAVAFSYDLCKSIIYMRQGNPEWAGLDRDGEKWPGVRAADMFFDNGDSWNDKSKSDIPQADEQMRLLTHILEWMSSFKKPLPRLWYFPDNKMTMTLFTGDSDFGGIPVIDDEFNTINNYCNSKGTIYLVEHKMPSPLHVSNWRNSGHEVAIHFDNTANKTNPTWKLTNEVYSAHLNNFKKLYNGLQPVSVRNHWVLWCGMDSTGKQEFAAQAEIEMNHGIKIDFNYYIFEPLYQGDVGYTTGSAIPMKFSKSNGTILDIFQHETQIPDETWYNDVFDKYKIMVNRSLHEGKFAWVNVNFHPSMWWVDSCKRHAKKILEYAKDNEIPIWSGEQMYNFINMRYTSSFRDILWKENQLSFEFEAPVKGEGKLTLMLPYIYQGKYLSTIEKDGTFLDYDIATIKGTRYALVGTYSGTYHFNISYTKN